MSRKERAQRGRGAGLLGSVGARRSAGDAASARLGCPRCAGWEVQRSYEAHAREDRTYVQYVGIGAGMVRRCRDTEDGFPLAVRPRLTLGELTFSVEARAA